MDQGDSSEVNFLSPLLKGERMSFGMRDLVLRMSPEGCAVASGCQGQSCPARSVADDDTCIGGTNYRDPMPGDPALALGALRGQLRAALAC